MTIDHVWARDQIHLVSLAFVLRLDWWGGWQRLNSLKWILFHEVWFVVQKSCGGKKTTLKLLNWWWSCFGSKCSKYRAQNFLGLMVQRAFQLYEFIMPKYQSQKIKFKTFLKYFFLTHSLEVFQELQVWLVLKNLVLLWPDKNFSHFVLSVRVDPWISIFPPKTALLLLLGSLLRATTGCCHATTGCFVASPNTAE